LTHPVTEASSYCGDTAPTQGQLQNHLAVAEGCIAFIELAEYGPPPTRKFPALTMLCLR
jgi:hypothetical protein